MSFSEEEVERYARHLVLREVGGQGQQRLKAARVLIVGMGGLGCPAAQYLAAAGVGRLTLLDPDTVSLSNLQRQILYTAEDAGHPKVAAAKARLLALNPHTEITAIQGTIDSASAAALIAGHDLVLDGTDSFAARLAVSDACVRARIPLVSGALGRWSGQVGVFNAKPCYRCLVPDIPPDAETCAAVGVIGALGGVIGAMMALEAVKLIAQAGEPLAGRLLVYDGLSGESRTVRLTADPACPSCGPVQAP